MNGDGANHVFKSYGLNVEGGYNKRDIKKRLQGLNASKIKSPSAHGESFEGPHVQFTLKMNRIRHCPSSSE